MKEIPIEELTYSGLTRWGLCAFLAILLHVMVAIAVVMTVSLPYTLEWGIIPALAIIHRYWSGYWLSNIFWRWLRPDAYQRPPERRKAPQPDIVVQYAESCEAEEKPPQGIEPREPPQRKRRKKKPRHGRR